VLFYGVALLGITIGLHPAGNKNDASIYEPWIWFYDTSKHAEGPLVLWTKLVTLAL